MPEGSFSAKVSDWVSKTKDSVKTVRDQSTMRVIAVMQQPVSSGGNMPVQTGFLQSSGRASIGGELPQLVPHPGGDEKYDWDPGAVLAVVQSADLGTTITFAYGADYAVFQEYGTSHMAGHRFVALAAQQWPQIVEQVSKNLQHISGGK